jgi:hypothetical protein
MITPHANAVSGKEFSASLANDDLAGSDNFVAKFLYTKSLARTWRLLSGFA